jgi:molybdenum cofactor cytidylyltransferase
MVITGKNDMAGKLGIVLLAAGASTRLGNPKQLLLHQGKTLLEHGLQVALDSGEKPIVAVLGANAEIMMKQIKNEAVHLVINKNWQEGIAASIRCGLEKLLEISPRVEAVIIMVCDQPFVTPKLLNDLASNYQESGKPIVASRYENSLGTPALFDKTIFTALLALKGDIGAKKFIREQVDLVSEVDFPLGHIDIDTGDDYDKLLNP